jgi:hypothetical protein
MADAVRELERGWSVPKRARDHHLRRAYALADLYERSGATPRARGAVPLDSQPQSRLCRRLRQAQVAQLIPVGLVSQAPPTVHVSASPPTAARAQSPDPSEGSLHGYQGSFHGRVRAVRHQPVCPGG